MSLHTRKRLKKVKINSSFKIYKRTVAIGKMSISQIEEIPQEVKKITAYWSASQEQKISIRNSAGVGKPKE